MLYVLGAWIADTSSTGEELSAWTQSYRWKKLYGIEFLYAGPLFIHQLSHMWIDFRGIQDRVHARAKALITSRTAAAPHTCSKPTRSATRRSSPVTANTAGASPRVTVPGPAERNINGIKRKASSTTRLAASRWGPT